MGRSPINCNAAKEVGVKRGAWSAEEDEKLVAYIKRYGIWNWNHMAKPAGLARSGKSCRLRWMNYLRPNLRHGNFTAEEEETIIRLHEKFGNRWATIAGRLHGRTDNEIKNYWNTRLKRHNRSVEYREIEQATESGSSSSTSTSTASTSEELTTPLGLTSTFWTSDSELSSENASESRTFNEIASFEEQHPLIPALEGMPMSMMMREDDFQEAMFMISAAGGFHLPDANLHDSISREYLIYDLWGN